MALNDQFLHFCHAEVDIVAQDDMAGNGFVTSLALAKDFVYMEISAPHKKADIGDEKTTPVVFISLQSVHLNPYNWELTEHRYSRADS